MLAGIFKKLVFGSMVAAVWDEMIRPTFVQARAVERAEHTGDPRPVLVVDGPIRHQLPHPDGSFSTVILNNSVERSEDPIGAVLEGARVADRVVVLAPPWWSLHTWIDPRNKWYISGTHAYPLYNSPDWNRPVELPPEVSHGAMSWKRWVIKDVVAPSWGEPLPYTDGQVAMLPPHPDVPTWA